MKDVKRPNAGHVSVSSAHSGSSEKKWDLCLIQLRWLDFSQTGRDASETSQTQTWVKGLQKGALT